MNNATRADILQVINDFLEEEGMALDADQTHYPILGEYFEEHDEGDQFVGRILKYFDVAKNTNWVDIHCFEDLITYILNNQTS